MLIVAAAAFIPMIIGAIYYSPAVMGNAWMRESGTTQKQIESGNMVKIMGISLLFSFMIAIMMNTFSNHQWSTQSLFVTDENFENKDSDLRKYFDAFIAEHNTMNRHRSFGHGAVHGGFAAIFIALPLLGIVSLFERRSFKYIGIQFLYWLIVLVLMCGVLSQWGLSPAVT